jgi:hypothetical protein
VNFRLCPGYQGRYLSNNVGVHAIETNHMTFHRDMIDGLELTVLVSQGKICVISSRFVSIGEILLLCIFVSISLSSVQDQNDPKYISTI